MILIQAFVCSALGQTPAPIPVAPARSSQQTRRPATTQDEDEVVRITTNLVQLDVSATDNNGHQITDLSPDDFEVREDNRPQKITNFSYVSTEAGATTATAAAAQPAATSQRPATRNAPPVPPVPLRPEQVRRTVALVVDDLCLSFESMHFVKGALRKFVDEQMQPGDLVAIIRTGGGAGVLQQFTSDRRQLYAAVEHVRWLPNTACGVSAVAQIDTSREPATEDPNVNPTNPAQDIQDRINEQTRDREGLFEIGTLGVIHSIVRGMREMPGRKSLILISDSLKIRTYRNIMGNPRVSSNESIAEPLRRLADLANRSSVVIYTMNATGLQTLWLTAADNTAHLSADQIEARLADRRRSYVESPEGLDYLARQTGGFAIRNMNDLGGGLRRVVEDQKGYYLIAYHPEGSNLGSPGSYRRFHKISIKVKRPGVKVRTRSGFYDFSDEGTRTVRHTREEQLLGALISPFNANGVSLQLTSLFANDAQFGSFMRSFIHIDAHDLTFTDDGDGWHKSTFDILAMTFGDNGQMVDQVGRTHTIRIKGDTYNKIMQDGFVYVVTVPVKKPGAYQLRTALRDTASERVGSASQFIEVPDITKNRLSLSGLLVSGVEAARETPPMPQPAPAATTPDAAQTLARSAEGESEDVDTQAGPAVRHLRKGMTLRYGYAIYNAQLDSAALKPQLLTQVRIFREGQLIFTGQTQHFNPSSQADMKRLLAGGALKLGSDMRPGEYVLQVIVTDLLAKANHNTAIQWIDFEIR
ncbi:MAG: hypothetical protein AUG51_16320 [Acidobacteria bacterium 13_1_20CM_3_53_8]|nr:MAG: hypothetical protein AUG51_16320 [Acidobacteria bacterium 13_1_20CM_3_53_8]